MVRFFIFFLFLIGLFSCGEEKKSKNFSKKNNTLNSEELISEKEFESANIKYNCPLCKENLALFCVDCESSKLYWCKSNENINSIICEDCDLILYPLNHYCASCNKKLRPNARYWKSLNNKNHNDCNSYY